MLSPSHIYPLRFTHRFIPKLWGGTRLAAERSSAEPIGEEWLVSALPGQETLVAEGSLAGKSLSYLVDTLGDLLLGEGQTAVCGGKFPLIVKLLDAQQNLSIQVHPAAAEPDAKDEFWYFLDCARESYICTGMILGTTQEQLQRALSEGSLEDLLEWTPVRARDSYFLPAGSLHGLGAGNLLLEVQDASDTTYRLYDFNRRDDQGRLRPLQIKEALSTLAQASTAVFATSLPLEARHFRCEELRIDTSTTPIALGSRTSMTLLIGIEGTTTLCVPASSTESSTSQYQLRVGEAILLPAALEGCWLPPGQGAALQVTLSDR